MMVGAGVSGSTIGLAIVDPRPIYQAGLQTLVERSGRIWVVGTATSGADGLALISARRPDVALVGERLPDGSGLDFAWQVRQLHPETGLVLHLSEIQASEWLLIETLKRGVTALVASDATPTELIEAIEAAHCGVCQVSLEAVGREQEPGQPVRDLLGKGAWAESLADRINRVGLSPRESMLLNLMAQGLSNKEIARRTLLSHQTVKNHVSNILRKLSASSRTDAVVTAIRNGWVATPTLTPTNPTPDRRVLPSTSSR